MGSLRTRTTLGTKNTRKHLFIHHIHIGTGGGIVLTRRSSWTSPSANLSTRIYPDSVHYSLRILIKTSILQQVVLPIRRRPAFEKNSSIASA